MNKPHKQQTGGSPIKNLSIY